MLTWSMVGHGLVVFKKANGRHKASLFSRGAKHPRLGSHGLPAAARLAKLGYGAHDKPRLMGDKKKQAESTTCRCFFVVSDDIT